MHHNMTRNIPGYIEKEVDYLATAARMLEADESCVTELLDVEPSVINYRFNVHLSNLTTQTVTIAPHTALCELQPVTVDEDALKTNRRTAEEGQGAG